MFSGHYAYPEGQKEHFNSETIEVLKKLGVRACPSAIQGLQKSLLKAYLISKELWLELILVVIN